ncbi:MAG: CoB--CoM heterodisulfide reductase iron-sulfur subunit B family protein [Spirochaetota bacterium]|nr:CoB--CoM heterodisulfide reductase iron-sulfur subunit B family protein [Spirochaetota bacterium]
MKYALFLGCTIPARLKQYETSARAVLENLNIELIDIPDFNCCGYPIRNFDNDSYLLSSARNIAIAQSQDLDLLTLCKCCYGSLKNAEHTMKEDPDKREKINVYLKSEGFEFKDGIEIRHMLSVLYHDVGIESLREKIIKPYKNINIATHYGCHALRPSDIVNFDDPVNPSLFDQLVEITGANSINWSKRLDCCGAPLLGVNDELSMDIMEEKLRNGKDSGADYLCVACPYCHLQFDHGQRMMISDRDLSESLSSLLYTQLLGLSMGIESDSLQIESNEFDISGIRNYL